ncbi:MAG: universal stress protein [Bacteroidetes bacterium]|nr:universal stress protein [Bacteroidota bacterium]
MIGFKKVLAGMDLSKTDDAIIRAAGFITTHFSTEDICFLHVVPDFNVPKNLSHQFQKLFAPDKSLEEAVEKKLYKKVKAGFDESSGVEVSMKVIEGKPYDKLIQQIEDDDIDLVIVGKKKTSHGSGITPKRMARKMSSSFLFVTPNTETEIKNVLVPVDFSENSARALQIAVELNRKDPSISVTTIYVVDMIPTGYYLETKEFRNFNVVLMDAAREGYFTFLKENKLDSSDMKAVFVENNYGNVGEHIYEYASSRSYDMIIMGARGHSPFETFLYGSVTEKLISTNEKIPILVVR